MSTQESLFPPSGILTSQVLALNFLLDDDPLNLLGPNQNTPATRVVQRYIAVVLYLETNGDKWTNRGGWLLGQHECDWVGLACVELTIASAPIINEGGNNGGGLGGALTIDTDLVVEVNLQNNNLQGSMPQEVGFFTSCGIFQIWGNQIGGTIPTTIGNMLPLTTLWLDDNELVGGIPTEVGRLRNLNDITVYSNQ